MDGTENRRSWGVEQRLEFVEFRLFWDGIINRSDITERFGVSVPQASNDLAAYRELAPENLAYDTSAKRYVVTEAFKPRFLEPNPDRYLAQLKAIADGIITVEDTWITKGPDWDVLPLPSRRLNPDILRGLLRAIRHGLALEIHYQSMNPDKPAPSWRWITPHALAFDGFRWHTRAFCHGRKDFVDFVINRCLGIGKIKDAPMRAQEDWKWQTTFDVILKPNPKLTKGQQRAIELDFGMTKDEAVLPIRYALLYYFCKRFHLDDARQSDDPRDNPVIVANRKEFNEALSKASGNST